MEESEGTANNNVKSKNDGENSREAAIISTPGTAATEPCGIVLKCGHECSGNDDECSQGRFHKRCSAKCDAPMVCNHICPYPCRKACRTCVEPCPFKCPHSKCDKLCGEVCTPCYEPCPRSCPHVRCTNFCSQPCLVPPCPEPCPQLLECGHGCAGFCGDPCLSKCKRCHPDAFEVFFGTEDEPDARFVQLQDCCHIVESSGMVQWLEQGSGMVAFKVCPLCKTPIMTTPRYSAYVREAALNVNKVKVKLAGAPEENADDAKELHRVMSIKYWSKYRVRHESIANAWHVLLKRLEPIRRSDGKRQPIDRVQVNAITSKFQLIERLAEATGNFVGKKNHVESICIDRTKAILEVVVTRDDDYITDQEIDDASREIDRLAKTLSLSCIDRTAHHQKMTPPVRELLGRADELAFAPRAFTANEDEELANILRELNRVFPITYSVSTAEILEIDTAMSFERGTWYTCKNGHPYVVGHCGSPEQSYTCDCGDRIGRGYAHCTYDFGH